MKSAEPSLLFTGGAGAGTEAIYTLWHKRYDLHFVDAEPAVIPPIVPASRRHGIPMASEENYVDALLTLCDRLGIHVVVPGVDEELPHMAAARQRRPSLRVLGPEPEYVTTMLDKIETMRALETRGVDVPRTATIDQVEAIGFPCVAKPRFGRGSRGVHVLREAAQAAAYGPLWRIGDEEIVVQELLEGTEYTVMMAADADAELRVVVPVRVDVKRGITLRAETEAEPTVLAACRRIHAVMPTSGCYNIQLMLTHGGRALPFEINPRISTTFCLGVAAGVDPVAIFLGEDHPPDDPGFRPGVRLKRSWTNHMTNSSA